MSLKGQSRRFRHGRGMSALLPTATINRTCRQVGSVLPGAEVNTIDILNSEGGGFTSGRPISGEYRGKASRYAQPDSSHSKTTICTFAPLDVGF